MEILRKNMQKWILEKNMMNREMCIYIYLYEDVNLAVVEVDLMNSSVPARAYSAIAYTNSHKNIMNHGNNFELRQNSRLSICICCLDVHLRIRI